MFDEAKMVSIRESASPGQNKRHISLSNGVELPLLGLGTTHSGGYNHEAVVYALQQCHYRMIDTAKRYGVEKNLGLAISDSNVPRNDLFLISKLWPVDFGFSRTRDAFRESCARLGITYLDAYLLHSPVVPKWFSDTPRHVREETWRALELLYESEEARAIGVSNFEQTDLEELFEFCCIKPHINQMEFHPYQNPSALRRFCADNDITFMGYCPLAKGSILAEPAIVSVAQRNCHTPAQVCICWSIQQNVSAIPKSTKFARLRENADVFDWSLSEDDMRQLNSLHDGRRLISLENWQSKFDLPEGYKLAGLVNSEHCSTTNGVSSNKLIARQQHSVYSCPDLSLAAATTCAAHTTCSDRHCPQHQETCKTVASFDQFLLRSVPFKKVFQCTKYCCDNTAAGLLSVAQQ